MIKRRESRPWNGYIHDIDDSRCDSFTEFGYEKNGVHVSRGYINITSPGDYYLDMHNNFHNNAYQQGELCPKIQAGELGNDTQLSPLYATDLLRLLSMQILRVWPVAVLAACHFLQLFLPAHVALNVGLFLGLLSLHQSQSDRRAAAQPDFQYAFGHIPGALDIPLIQRIYPNRFLSTPFKTVRLSCTAAALIALLLSSSPLVLSLQAAVLFGSIPGVGMTGLPVVVMLLCRNEGPCRYPAALERVSTHPAKIALHLLFFCVSLVT